MLPNQYDSEKKKKEEDIYMCMIILVQIGGERYEL